MTRTAGLTLAFAAVAMGGCSPSQKWPSESAATVTSAAAEPQAPGVPPEEYAARRRRLLDAIRDGVLLLHARPAEKAMEQWGFIQDPAFYYFTGLGELPGAVLALDGATGRADLFLPPAPHSFGVAVDAVAIAPGQQTARRLGVDAARSADEFAAWLRSRLAHAPATVYLDEPRRPEETGSPAGLLPTAGDRTLWRTAISTFMPDVRIASAKDAIVELRAVKSEAEIAILRRNARITARALLAGAGRVKPGVRQREVEAAVVSACIEAGGQGPSFWPWTMAGPNAHTPRLVEAFFRYEQLDRVIQAGEVMRMDIGCAGGSYGADVGRTLPVSGRFSEGQSEAWALLVAGYQAGLEAMRSGVPISAVRIASNNAVRALQPSLRTDQGRAAAVAILRGGPEVWHIHGVGVDSGEDITDPLAAGMVVAYEPGIAAGEDAFYLEDMILVTREGHEVLSAGLPYTPDQISASVRYR